jgi:hypothetical protein
MKSRLNGDSESGFPFTRLSGETETTGYARERMRKIARSVISRIFISSPLFGIRSGRQTTCGSEGIYFSVKIFQTQLSAQTFFSYIRKLVIPFKNRGWSWFNR